MGRYILRRSIAIIPMLFFISLIGFFLSRNVPQDQVISYLQASGFDIYENNLDPSKYIEYLSAKKKLNYHLPQFYFGIYPRTPKPVNPESIQFFLPTFKWYGTNNQYHKWIVKAIQFDFGHSFIDGKLVLQKITTALGWTFWLVLISLIMIFAISIPLGIFVSKPNHSKVSDFLNFFFYGFYAIPLFWLATLMLMFFTTDDYGTLTNIFPSVGVIYDDISIGKKVTMLLLPVIVIVIHTIAYVSRQMSSGILQESTKNYSVTGLSKGLNRYQVIKKHNLPNALFPMITLATAIVPASFSGSLIIEVIFNIPGIGRLLYNSIQTADWNVVFALLLIIGFITMISYLIGDILYTVVNPKVKLT